MSKRSHGPVSTAAHAAEPSRDRPAPQVEQARKCDDAFLDLWLKLELHDTFDAVVAEPIPEDLLRLIEEDRSERERIRRSRGRGGAG